MFEDEFYFVCCCPAYSALSAHILNLLNMQIIIPLLTGFLRNIKCRRCYSCLYI